MAYLKDLVRDPRVPGGLLRLALFALVISGAGALTGLARFDLTLLGSLVMGSVSFFLGRDLALRAPKG